MRALSLPCFLYTEGSESTKSEHQRGLHEGLLLRFPRLDHLSSRSRETGLGEHLSSTHATKKISGATYIVPQRGKVVGENVTAAFEISFKGID